ncbi:MAG TPA: lactate racemase domain-containing protein [Gaiellaceae bacterium]
MTRVPLLADTRLVVAEAGTDDLVLHAPRPPAPLRDVPAATREALAFPLAGPPLPELVRPGGSATIVIEQPVLPIPGAPSGPRHGAIAAVADELARLGVEKVTILVAGGLLRRTTPREIAALVPPEFRRRFRGRVIVHDVEAEDLVWVGELDGVALRVNRALVETDVVVTVTAAETVLHGGPAALVAASGSESLLAAEALSLLEPGTSSGWRLARELERRLAERVAVFGVSLVLDTPRLAGPLAGYPFDQQTIDRLLGSRLQRVLQRAPRGLRQAGLERIPRTITAAAVFGGPPSVAHAEALLRGTLFKSVEVDEPVDAIVVGVPPTTPFVPRERPNPVSAAYLGLGLALRLWRDAAPVTPGGTAILVHPFQRRFPRPTQTPYRALFFEPRPAGDPAALAAAERAAGSDQQARESYRAGRAAHPLQPFAEWRACAATAAPLGAVLIAGCRDAQAARQLGYIGVHGLGAAVEMARGRGARRIAYLLAPPYFPLVVGYSSPR